MNTSRLNHHVRHNWEIVFLLLLILVLFCLAGGLLVRRVTDVSIYEFLPVALDSVLATDYGLDPNPTRRPPLRLDIIWDTIQDHDPDAEDLAERQEALLDKLLTPVPLVTPQLCQGRHVIFAIRDTWLDSTRPTDINGTETTLRLGFSDTGRKRPLLYFPVSDRIPPGTFIGRAILELDLPPDTPPAVPGGVCFFNLNSGFDETGTNWSNQPEVYLPYCSQPIPGTGRLHTWDVTGLVNDWLQGHYPNSGLMIDLASPAAIEPVYLSREAAGLANFQTADPARQVGPRLVIDCGGAPPASEAGEIAQLPPTAAPGLPAGTGIPQTPAIAATGTAPAGSPPPVSATPPATPVVPPTGTRAATVTAPAATATRPVSTGSPTPAASPTRPVSTGSPVAPSPTVPPATSTSVPPATSTSVPPATSTSPPEPTSKPATSTPAATSIPTSTPSPIATALPTATSIPQADLVISKSAPVDPVLAGANLAYTLNVSNNGPAAATGVTVTDNLPPAVSLVSTASSQGGCTGTGILTCALGDISPGGAASITVVVNVPAGATGTLANSATVSAGQVDPNPANNTGTVVTTISQAADLAISKSDSPDPVAAGQTLTYTLTITNTGPANATGVTVSDTLPANVAFASAPAGCSHNSGLVTCDVGSLASGATRAYPVVVTVDPAASGTLINGATVTGSETDPNTANNTATTGTIVSTQADLAISKSDSPDPVVAGNTLTYTLAITNNGPAIATGVVFTDTLPADVAFASAPAGCTHTAGVVTCAVGSLASGATRTYPVVVAIDPAASGTLINTATVAGNETDPNTGNNTAIANTIVSVETDLVITKSAIPGSVNAGQPINYMLSVTNNGPANATGVVITDTLPPGVTVITAPGCAIDGNILTCPVGNVDSGKDANQAIIIRVNPETPPGAITNLAQVGGNEFDPIPANNTATVGAIITTSADLAASISAAPEVAIPGDSLTYTIVVSNSGPSAATGAVITDTLPANAAFTSAPAGCSHATGRVTCNTGSLASGATRTYQVIVTVDPAASGTLINSATVTGSETDPDTGNNTTTISTTVLVEADLAISKSVDNAAPLEQEQILYQVTVVNGGPSHATGVVISDPLPVGLTYVSDNSAGTYNSGSGVWTLGNLSSGAGVTLLITATVNTETAGKTITNTALIDASDQTDPVPGNNTASVTITPALPALSIGDVTISEGDSGTTEAIFTVTLSAASAQTITVSYGTADNTATLADNDYNAAGGTLTFSPGVTTQTVTVQVNGDTALESNETFFVNLSNPAGAGINDGQGQGTILDDDGLSIITLTDVWDAWIEENNPGNIHGDEDNMQVQPPSQEYRTLINFHTLTTALPAGSAILTATLHLYQDGVRSGQAISIYPLTTNWIEGEVKWSKAANGPGGDWLNPAGGGDFDTGTTWATFDPATDGHRYINITGLVQAWLAGTYDNYGMILTSTSSGLDDGAVKFYTHEHTTPAWRPSLEITYTSGSVSPLSLSIGNVTVSEGDSGTTPAVFNVTLSGASTQTVTVDYATADNTATTADNDYLATGGILTFAPGVTQQSITVTVVGDTRPENSQSFFVNLSNPQNAAIADGQGVGTILQDVGGLSLPEGADNERLYLPVIVKPGH